MGAFTASPKRVYNWYISLVAASCMVLYGYDASVFNALQGSKHWVRKRALEPLRTAMSSNIHSSRSPTSTRRTARRLVPSILLILWVPLSLVSSSVVQ